MSDRRDFIKNVSAAGLLSGVPSMLLPRHDDPPSVRNPSDDKMWGCLLHLSYNFWVEYSTPSPFRGYRPYLQVDDALWRDATDRMAKEGMNMVVIDLGDG